MKICDGLVEFKDDYRETIFRNSGEIQANV